MLIVLNTIQLHLPQTFSVFAGICVNKAFFACEKSCLPIQANHLVNMQRNSMLIFSLYYELCVRVLKPHVSKDSRNFSHS